jgi:alpha-D-xyloside xylohydrolase
MAESLRGGLSLALSGFGYWSHDIGGFEGTPDPVVFKRWIPFGLLSSHSRLHGNESYRVPWNFDDESVDVLRRFTRLKLRLMPYLYAAAVTAHREGLPVMRPMVLEFPDDPACSYLDRQYLLGDSLLVAPVFSADGDTRYYLPDGRWTDLLTGRALEGGRWITERHEFASVPLFVRPSSVIALGARTDRPDYDYAADVTLLLTAIADGADIVTTVPDTAGEVAAAFRTTRTGATVRVERTQGSAPWNVLVASPGATLVTERSTVADPLGPRITLPADADTCEFALG